MRYGLTVNLLGEVLPLGANAATAPCGRAKNGLEDEQFSCIPACLRLPEPDPSLTVGIDGCYVHARDGENCKAGWFEVSVGKSITDLSSPLISLVTKRRLEINCGTPFVNFGR